MRHIILRGQRVPTVEYSLCIYMYIYIYIYIYLFIGLSGFMVHSMIVYGVNLFTMPGMLLNATCCLREVVESLCCNQLLFTVNRIKLSTRQLSTSLKPPGTPVNRSN